MSVIILKQISEKSMRFMVSAFQFDKDRFYVFSVQMGQRKVQRSIIFAEPTDNKDRVMNTNELSNDGGIITC